MSYLFVVGKNERRNYTASTGWTHNEVKSGARRQFHARDNMIEWRGSLRGQSYELVECRNAIHHVARPWRIDGEYANRLNRERERERDSMRKEGKTEKHRARGTVKRRRRDEERGREEEKRPWGPVGTLARTRRINLLCQQCSRKLPSSISKWRGWQAAVGVPGYGAGGRDQPLSRASQKIEFTKIPSSSKRLLQTSLARYHPCAPFANSRFGVLLWT